MLTAIAAILVSCATDLSTGNQPPENNEYALTYRRGYELTHIHWKIRFIQNLAGEWI